MRGRLWFAALFDSSASGALNLERILNVGYSNSNAARVGLGTADPVTKQIEFVSCGLANTPQLVLSEGLRDGRARYETSAVFGTRAVGGPLVMDVRPDELAVVLPYILGAAASGENFATAETLTEFYALVDKVADIYLYAGCKVNQATFRSSANQLLNLSLDVVAKTETGGQTFPAISSSLSAFRPYIHHQGVLTLGGTAYPHDNLEITINNALQSDVYRNSQERTDIPEGDRIVTLAADFPFSATEESAFYQEAIAGLAGSMVYTQSGAINLTFTFANLKWAAASPIINGRGQEIGWRISFQAFKTSGGNEIAVVNSSV